MLSTLLGPPVVVDVVELPPQAASVMTTVTRTIGKRFMVILPFRLLKRQIQALREL